MKQIFKLMLSLLAISAVMTACSKDDESAAQKVAGKYVGTVKLTAAGEPSDAVIELMQTGNNLKMTLKESSFNAVLAAPIVIEGVTVVQSGSVYKFAGKGTASLKDQEGNPGPSLSISMSGEGSPADLKLVIQVPLDSPIDVIFTGARK